MAFLNQLTSKLQELKEVTKSQLPQVIEQANKAKQNLLPVLNKCTHQLDSLGKILQVSVDRKQSPIDLLPLFTAFDPALENATFKANYDDTCQLSVHNLGSCIAVRYPPEGSSADMSVSFLPEEDFHLEQINFHWGSELHFIHRNTKYPTMDIASKQPNGVVTFAVFLNESHQDNMQLLPIMKVLSNVNYSGTESALMGLRANQLLPGNEKNKEFWLYEGSETVEPFREVVKWIVFRSAVPISSAQLDRLRELRSSRAENEVEEKMVSIRALQPLNSRLIRSSFKSVAGAELPSQ